MKRFAVMMLLAVFLIPFGGRPVAAGEIDILIDKLVEKQILTRPEAKEIKKDVQEESAKGKKGTDLNMYWKDGIRFDSPDKAFEFKLGGRIMNDWAFMSEDDDLKDALGKMEDVTTEFRRARLYLSGTIYGKIIFKSQYDFAGGDPDIKDMYIGLKKLSGVGTLKIGHFKEAFGLEELTSSKYITFMERSLPAVFTPGRNTGIGVSKTEGKDKRFTWALGTFLNAGSYGDESGSRDNLSVTGRITGLPWDDAKDKLLHLGLAASYRDAVDDAIRFRERPEAHLADYRFVDTGSFEADSENRLGLEAALVYESFSAQAEYITSMVDSEIGEDPDFSGYYAYVSYFLTGEHRNYKNSAGAFSRITPDENAFQDDGKGAWEVCLRYSDLDLSDGDIEGGELQDITVGLNWYLNPNVRVMWNYVMADVDDVGDADIFQMRFQTDF